MLISVPHAQEMFPKFPKCLQNIDNGWIQNAAN